MQMEQVAAATAIQNPEECPSFANPSAKSSKACPEEIDQEALAEKTHQLIKNKSPSTNTRNLMKKAATTNRSKAHQTSPLKLASSSQLGSASKSSQQPTEQAHSSKSRSHKKNPTTPGKLPQSKAIKKENKKGKNKKSSKKDKKSKGSKSSKVKKAKRENSDLGESRDDTYLNPAESSLRNEADDGKLSSEEFASQGRRSVVPSNSKELVADVAKNRAQRASLRDSLQFKIKILETPMKTRQGESMAGSSPTHASKRLDDRPSQSPCASQASRKRVRQNGENQADEDDTFVQNKSPSKRQRIGLTEQLETNNRPCSQGKRASLSLEENQKGKTEATGTVQAIAKTDSTTEEDGNSPTKDAKPVDPTTILNVKDKSASPIAPGQPVIQNKDEKLDKEMKSIVNFLKKQGGTEKSINDFKNREKLRKLVKNALNEDSGPSADPSQAYVHIQVRKGVKNRVYLFELDRKICVFTFQEGGKRVRVTTQNKKPTASQKKLSDKALADPVPDQPMKEGLCKPKGRGKKKAAASVQQIFTVDKKGKVATKGTPVQPAQTQKMNALELCTGGSPVKNDAEAEADGVLQSSVLGKFYEQKTSMDLGLIPKVPKPSKGKKGAKPKQERKPRAPRTKKNAQPPQFAEEEQATGMDDDIDLEAALKLTSGQKRKPTSKKQPSRTATRKKQQTKQGRGIDDIENSFPELENLPDFKLKTSSEPQQDSIRGPFGNEKVELPPNVKKFISDTVVNFNGDKLAELKENDMVCKLIYGHLNRTVEVTKKDFKFLEPGVYLNDILILFYLRFLQYYVIPKDLENQVYIFDPQFFTKLQESPKFNQRNIGATSAEERYTVSHGYKSVKRWTKKIDLFQKNYILVPICQDQHWTLAVIHRAHLVEQEMKAHIAECQKIEEAKKNGVALANEVEDSYLEDELGDGGDPHRLRQEIPDDVKSLLTQTAPPVKRTNIRETMQKTPPEEIKADELIEEDQEMLNLDQTDSNIDEPQHREPLKGGGGMHASDDDVGDDYGDEGMDQAMMDDDDDEHMAGEFDSDEDEYMHGNHPMTGQVKKAFASDSEAEGYDEYGEFDGSDDDMMYGKYQHNMMGMGMQGFQSDYMGQGSRAYHQVPKRPQMPDKACSDKPIILFMDSLNADSVDEMMQFLREYLELEYLEKKCDPAHKKYFLEPAYRWKMFDHVKVPHYRPNLPKQKNFTDCGLFVLQYAETFLMQPEFVLDDLHQRQGTLFHDRIVDSKRDEIMRIIMAIGLKTSTSEKIGESYRNALVKMKQKKTHFKLPSAETPHAQEEEKKADMKQAMELTTTNNSGQGMALTEEKKTKDVKSAAKAATPKKGSTSKSSKQLQQQKVQQSSSSSSNNNTDSQASKSSHESPSKTTSTLRKPKQTEV